MSVQEILPVFATRTERGVSVPEYIRARQAMDIVRRVFTKEPQKAIAKNHVTALDWEELGILLVPPAMARSFGAPVYVIGEVSLMREKAIDPRLDSSLWLRVTSRKSPGPNASLWIDFKDERFISDESGVVAPGVGMSTNISTDPFELKESKPAHILAYSPIMGRVLEGVVHDNLRPEALIVAAGIFLRKDTAVSHEYHGVLVVK